MLNSACRHLHRAKSLVASTEHRAWMPAQSLDASTEPGCQHRAWTLAQSLDAWTSAQSLDVSTEPGRQHRAPWSMPTPDIPIPPQVPPSPLPPNQLTSPPVHDIIKGSRIPYTSRVHQVRNSVWHQTPVDNATSGGIRFCVDYLTKVLG
jgi:hypothetical protein